jgi:nicotinamide-nucleotide amidase
MELIIIHGAVSEQIARAMAEGALRNSHAQLTVSITGMASPSIEECRALPGEVWIAVASSEASTISSVFFFEGDREEVRLQATGHALQMMLDYLE